MKLPPRNTLSGTRAEQLLRRDFYGVYLRHRYADREDLELADATSVFTPEGLRQLRDYLTEDALKAPVIFTEHLSNRVLAVHLVQNTVERIVVLNMRFKVDPDVLVHALIEEYAHSQQVLDGIDFAQQRAQFAYAERPYELDAKRIATTILGYDPDIYETYLIREEHSDVFYDIR